MPASNTITHKQYKKHMSKTCKKTCKYGATMTGLHHWYKDAFEKLGWMILAKKRGGMNDVLMTYHKSLCRLKTHLECKIQAVEEHDRKMDLQIMWDNVCILIAHAKKDLGN